MLLVVLARAQFITDAALGEGSAHRTWALIQTNARKEALTAEGLDALPQVLADEGAIERIRELYELAQRKEPESERAWRELYAEFVRAYPTSDVLYDFLSSGFARMLKRDRPAPRPVGGRGRHYAWYWGHWGRAAVYAYKATGERRFLDLIVSTYEELLEVRDDALGLTDDVKGRIVLSWATTFNENTVRANEITVAGLVTLPVTEFLLLLKEEPALAEQYGDVAPRFLATVEQAVWEFEEDYRTISRGTVGYYMHPFNREIEALNHTHQLGATLANLYALTGDERYRQRVLALVEYFRACITRDDNDSYSWPYEPTPAELANLPAEPIWKGQATMALPLAAYRHGLAFTERDMQRFARTVTENIWLDEERLNHYISRRRLLPLEDHPPSRKSLYTSLAGWIFLDEFDPLVRERIVRYMATHPRECPKAWFGGARIGVLALTYMMAIDAERRDQGAVAATP